MEGKLESILKGENEELSRIFGQNKSKAVKLLKEILKNENGGFSAEGILTNKRLLGLILAFDSKNEIINFINDPCFGEKDLVYTLNLNTYTNCIGLVRSQLKWQTTLPLVTLYQLEDLVGNISNQHKNLSPWVSLLSLVPVEKLGIMSLKQGSELKLPEGLIGLEFESNVGIESNPYEKSLIENIRYAKHIICPSSLQYIGKGLSGIESIQLNEGLIEIKDNSFKGCSNLERITTNGNNCFQSSLHTIGNNAFSGCIRLEETKLGEELQEIGKAAFEDCYKFKRIKFPNSLRVIGDNAFEGCECLEEVIINKGLATIGNRAFANNHSLALYSVPNHKINIGDDLFKLDRQPHWQKGFHFEPGVKSNITMQIRGKDIQQTILEQYSETISWTEEVWYGVKYVIKTRDVFYKRIKDIEIKLSEKEENGTAQTIKYVPKHFPNPNYEETPEQVYSNLTEKIRQYNQDRDKMKQ